MYSQHPDALPELAERLSGLTVHDPGGPAQCLVRTGQLLVPRARVEDAARILRRWVDTVETDGPGLLRLRPPVAADCVRIAADVAERVPVAANHVHLVGTPVLHGTGAVPTPADPPPPPPREVWAPPVTVTLFDTGLDPHPWFADRPWFDPATAELLDEDADGHADRQAGHGTFVAGVLLRHAPGVTIRAHRVLTPRGLTDDRTLAAALHHESTRPHPHVIVLTAGCHTADDRCPPVLADELARFPTTAVVAAAGNTGTTRPFWPAALPGVVAVGASALDGSPAPFTNRGPWVDRHAPGVDVLSSHVRLAGGMRTFGAARWSGTSFAAPRVAAEIARARLTPPPPPAPRARAHPGP
ncbi:Peptidase S8 and S53, subtilisin, kexin, sedolisin [Actinokineospora spheciospongiae]|uniref:Peptidase S8 and S53, subtilisin, kexin, sedolisin n=1 Tax=Actinokineospora spheciospongiae TaxID=909613 RepID=W7ICK0_9PSEU|nr:Peptidase S8 and S53, subtilisin, kexin, sedolisin [Actinokineospora spheciospongiae]